MAAKYAQHFLTNQHAAERIVNSLDIGPTDSVLEIGPGKGVLTAHLLKAKTVVVIEVDADMVVLLKHRFGSNSQLQVVHEDILRFDLNSLTPSPRGGAEAATGDSPWRGRGQEYKVVGNLPYNLTSPILRKLCDWPGWSFAILMVQKEVGDRLCAKVGTSDYGALTVGMNLTCQMERVFDLSETSFKPAPKVRSSVVKIIRREKPLTNDITGTQRVIQAAFQQRRKTLLNSLSHGLGVEKKDIQAVLEGIGIDPALRPERLEVAQFIALSEKLRSTT